MTPSVSAQAYFAHSYSSLVEGDGQHRQGENLSNVNIDNLVIIIDITKQLHTGYMHKCLVYY